MTAFSSFIIASTLLILDFRFHFRFQGHRFVITESFQFPIYSSFSPLMFASGSGELKTKLPATRASAPAFTKRFPVSKLTPPSISIRVWELRFHDQFLQFVNFIDCLFNERLSSEPRIYTH